MKNDLSSKPSAVRSPFEATDTTMTPYGGIVPFGAFLKRLGFVDALMRTCPVQRTSGNAAPVRDIVVSLILLNIW